MLVNYSSHAFFKLFESHDSQPTRMRVSIKICSAKNNSKVQPVENKKVHMVSVRAVKSIDTESLFFSISIYLYCISKESENLRLFLGAVLNLINVWSILLIEFHIKLTLLNKFLFNKQIV